MTESKGYQPIYDTGEPYYGYSYTKDVVYLEEVDAIKEIEQNGYTEEFTGTVVQDGEIVKVTKYRFASTEEDEYYEDPGFAYVQEVIIRGHSDSITLRNKLIGAGCEIREIEHPELEVTEIQVPFLNHLNDYLIFYITNEENSDNYVITDDGYTFNELELAGVDVNRNMPLMWRLAKPLNIQIKNKEEVFVEAAKEDLIEKIHFITQYALQLYVLIDQKKLS